MTVNEEVGLFQELEEKNLRGLNGNNIKLSRGKEYLTLIEHVHESVYLTFVTMRIDTIIVTLL